MTTPVRASFRPSTASKLVPPTKRPLTTTNGKLAGRPVARAGRRLPTTVTKRIPTNQKTASKLPAAQTIKSPAPNTPAIAAIAPAVKATEKPVDKKEQANTTMYRALMATVGAACLGAVYLRLRRGGNNNDHSSSRANNSGNAPDNSNDLHTSSSSQSNSSTHYWWPFSSSSSSQSHSSQTSLNSSQPLLWNTNTSDPYACTKAVKFIAPYKRDDRDIYDATFNGTCLNGELISTEGSLFCNDLNFYDTDHICTANGTFSITTTSVKAEGFLGALFQIFSSPTTTVQLQDGNYRKLDGYDRYNGVWDRLEVEATVKDYLLIDTTVRSDFWDSEKLVGNFNGTQLTSGKVYKYQDLMTDGDYVYDSNGVRFLNGTGISCNIEHYRYVCWEGNHNKGKKEGKGSLFSINNDDSRNDCGSREYSSDMQISGFENTNTCNVKRYSHN